MKDQRGVVYLETLVAFLPVFLFFLATLQIADLSAAHIIVRHAATVAARAAVVVMPDDGRYYNDEDNEKLHAFDGLRRQDIEHAADLILRANPRLDNAPLNVVVGFQSPPTPPPPSPNRFACPPDAPKPCMSREEVLAAAFNSQTAGEVLDTSTKGEGDWGMREKLDALVTAKYRCMIRFFCPRDFTMVATASLLYQGARYTYEAWPDSIRSDGRPAATPAAPVGPPSQIPGGPPGSGNAPGGQNPSAPNPSAPPANAPTDPGTLPDDAIAGQEPAQPGSSGSTTNPGVSEAVANVPPGSTRPGEQVGSGSTPISPPTAAAPGSSSPPSGSTPSNPVANNPSPTRPSAPVASHPSPATPSTPGASSSPATSSNGQVASNTPSTDSSSSTRPDGSTGTGPGASNSNANNANGAVASNGSSHTANSTGSRTRPSIVAREPTDSDAPTVTPTNRRNQASNATQGAADSSDSDRASQTGVHAAATPANNGGSTRGNTQTGTNTASNNGASATNPTRGPAPTRGPPGTNANSGRDTQGVISSAVTSNEGSSPTIPGNDRSNANTPASSASIIANGPDANGNAANRGSRAPRNLAELRAQLPSDIRNVPIVSDPSLQGNTVRAHYTYDARGRVTGVEIRVGPNAQPRHIADHVNTVRTLQGYQGLSGRVRLVLDKLNAWIAGHPNVRPGSLAWETRREVEKLQAIVDARTQALDGANLTQAQRTELENERREYARQLAQHEANLATITNEPGRGYVAAEDTNSRSDARAATEQNINAQRVRDNLPPIRVPPAPSGYHWRFHNGLPIVARNRIVAGRPPRYFDPNATPDPNDTLAQFPERPGIVPAIYLTDANGARIVERVPPSDDLETLANDRQQIADAKRGAMEEMERVAKRLGLDPEFLKGADGSALVQAEMKRAAQRLGYDLSSLGDTTTEQQILDASSGRTTGPLARQDARRLRSLQQLMRAQADYKLAELQLTQASERLGSAMAEQYMAANYSGYTQSYPAHPPGHPYEPGKSGEFDFVYMRGTPPSEIIIVEAKGAGGKLTSAAGYQQGSPDYVRHIALMMASRDPANAKMWNDIANGDANAPNVRYLHVTAPLKENIPSKDHIPWEGEVSEFDLSNPI